MSTFPTALLAADGTMTAAEVRGPLSVAELDATEDVWYPFLLNATQALLLSGVPVRQLPQHKHWMWSNKARRYHGIPGYAFYGVFCADEVEGLMLFNTVRECRLPPQKNAPLVYVDYLATAPWNLRPMANVPRYRGVGKSLLQFAVAHSQDLGMGGRIGLHSLPQAESFYRDTCGMAGLGEDPNEHNLPYFEMTEVQAKQFIGDTA